MLAVQWRTHRRGTLVWMFALIASMVGTAGAVAGLYTTPEKIHTYAQAVTAGDALVAINGRVEGIDSLGGIIQDEFGFLAAFLLPLLGISLVAQVTRREEEAGRLEAVLAGRVARHVPVLAGLIARLRRHLRHRHRVRPRAHRLRGTRDPIGPLRRLPRRPRLRLRRARGAARPGHPALPGRLHVGPARPRRGLRAAGRRRRDEDVGHLALAARLGREGRALRGRCGGGPSSSPSPSAGCSPRSPSSSPDAATSAAPSSAGARDRRGRRHGCAARSGWRPPSTARRSSVGSPVP